MIIVPGLVATSWSHPCISTWNLAFLSNTRDFPIHMTKLLIPTVSGYHDRPEGFLHSRESSIKDVCAEGEGGVGPIKEDTVRGHSQMTSAERGREGVPKF